MDKIKSLKLAGALVGGLAASGAHAEPVKYYQPTLDITKDPGCGKKLTTKEARIEHNRKLAEMYVVNFQQAQRRGRNYDYSYWGCMAPGANFLLGTADPMGTGMKLPAAAVRSKGELSGEQRGYISKFDYYQPKPGTTVIIPFEEGAFLRTLWSGKAKEDGKTYTIWEVIVLLVDDEGRIYHWDNWTDSIGLDLTTKMIFGKSIVGLKSDGYVEATGDFPKEDAKP